MASGPAILNHLLMAELTDQIVTNTSKKDTERINKPFKKLGFSKLDAVEVGSRLKVLLANYQMMYNKLRNFHWNVEGDEFFELHEVFEEEYHFFSEEIDTVAERIRIFGLKPHSTPSRMLQLSKIDEVRKDMRPYEMVKAVRSDLEALHELLLDTLESALDTGDVGTEYMLNQMIFNLEKRHWMYNAYLKE